MRKGLRLLGRYSEEEKATMVEMFWKGSDYRAIAKKYGVNPTSVAEYLDAVGATKDARDLAGIKVTLPKAPWEEEVE